MTNAGKQKFPKWWQALLIFVGGIVLGLSSCAAFLNGISGNARSSSTANTLVNLFAAGFLAGVVAAIAGFVLLIVALVSGDRSLP
jgi:hypothetical protein